MSRAHLVEKMCKYRELFPYVSDKVVHADFKKGNNARNEIKGNT